MRIFWTMALAAITATLTYQVFVCWADWLHLRDSRFIAQTLIITVVVHELAHWIVLEVNRIPSLLVFATFVGGAVSLPAKGGKRKALHWSNLAAIYLAGVIANLALAAGYYLAGRIGSRPAG